MTDENVYLELTHEVDVEARCVLHGKDYISMHPRIINLGHGRAVINMGQASCRGPGCNGTSQWLTLELVITNWEKVTEDQFKGAMRHALEMEMGAAMAASPPADEDDEPEEEEVPVAAPRTEQPAVPSGPGGGLLIRRPPLGGVRAAPGGVPSLGVSAESPE